ncbi:SigE family RNA polymerase sigma factor [Oryzobacter terrae]|uniref:SigE family RNA polymerase sigma factor n=1 Tax=Oryzobacter terrae TaxID=1620385 RepID=UPI00366B3825
MSTTGKSERDVAFTAFVESASPSLLRTAWLLTGDHHAAHDLVQAALVRTYVAWPRVRSDSALAYARRVLVNERTDRWRRHGAEVAVSELPEAASSSASATAGSDDRDAVVRLLARLPEQQRRVVVLRYYVDLSEQAVADLLNLSVGTVKSTASRGLAALRAELTTAGTASGSTAGHAGPATAGTATTTATTAIEGGVR